MSEQGLPVEVQPLSQVERVVDTFVAPSKTFTDILRSTSWWLPFLMLLIVTVASTLTVDKKIGFDRVAETSIQQSASSEERMSQLSPDQRARQMHIIGVSMKVVSYGFSILALVISLVIALLNWASLNFGLGAKTTFGQNFAVVMYAGLPRLFVGLLNIIFVFTGVNTENYNLNNPVGTNLGYYLTDSPKWLQTAATSLDVFAIWTLVLSILGLSIISGKTKGQAAIVAVGWFVFFLIIGVGFAAMQS
jgi:hypothetical protein